MTESSPFFKGIETLYGSLIQLQSENRQPLPQNIQDLQLKTVESKVPYVEDVLKP